MLFTQGIFMDPSNQPNAPKPVCAHAVVIIDYGTEDGVDFYIIKIHMERNGVFAELVELKDLYSSGMQYR